MTRSISEVVRGSVLSDLFKSGTDLANLGVLGILAVAVVALSYLMYKAYKREIARADLAMAGWQAATTQFERALDLIEKGNALIERMQNRKRSGDAR